MSLAVALEAVGSSIPVITSAKCLRQKCLRRNSVRDLQIFHKSSEAFASWSAILDVGLVEAWAAGASWQQLMSDCNLDGGDMARLLSRTVDLLRQTQHCSALTQGVRKAAKEAVKSMSRAPITDNVS